MKFSQVMGIMIVAAVTATAVWFFAGNDDGRNADAESVERELERERQRKEAREAAKDEAWSAVSAAYRALVMDDPHSLWTHVPTAWKIEIADFTGSEEFTRTVRLADSVERVIANKRTFIKASAVLDNPHILDSDVDAFLTTTASLLGSLATPESRTGLKTDAEIEAFLSSQGYKLATSLSRLCQLLHIEQADVPTVSGDVELIDDGLEAVLIKVTFAEDGTRDIRFTRESEAVWIPEGLHEYVTETISVMRSELQSLHAHGRGERIGNSLDRLNATTTQAEFDTELYSLQQLIFSES